MNLHNKFQLYGGGWEGLETSHVFCILGTCVTHRCGGGVDVGSSIPGVQPLLSGCAN